VIGKYAMIVHVIFVNCDLLFLAFVGSLFSKYFQAKVNGNIFCSSSDFRDKTLCQRVENE